MITIGIATLKVRELAFRETIKSVYDQADRIIVTLNLYDTVPDWLLSMNKVTAVIGDNSLGDAGKFLKVEQSEGYYFSIDDDLRYPPDYCQYMISKINQLNCIVTLHGRRFDRIPISRFPNGTTLHLHCLNGCKTDTEVHVGGSGVMAFDTRLFSLSINDFKHPNMADIWVAKRAREQGVKIMVVEHKAGYVRYMPPPSGTTIYDICRRNPNKIQTDTINNFLK